MENKKFEYIKEVKEFQKNLSFLYKYVKHEPPIWNQGELLSTKLSIRELQTDWFVLSTFHKPISKIIILTEEEFDE